MYYNIGTQHKSNKNQIGIFLFDVECKTDELKKKRAHCRIRTDDRLITSEAPYHLAKRARLDANANSLNKKAKFKREVLYMQDQQVLQEML